MKIRLKVSNTTLGKKGDVISVGNRLAEGLFRKNQAEPVKQSLSTDYTALEAAELVRNMTPNEAERFTKGETRKTVLKELKDDIPTKELKEEYQTK